MAFNSKPSGMNIVWASAGDILDPGDTKYQTGWGVEIPPRQWENYSQNKQDGFMAHANQLGMVDWDAETEYQANKSYVQGTTNGTVYRCILTHTNQDPELDVTNTYWIIAFASAGDFYTKTETDSLYLAKAQNLADLTNTATARTNLSVYSQAQTYTQAEVDAKTTVASTAQAQSFVSNTTLITPLRLKEAFQGLNQSISTNGFQKLPNGLIIQWGAHVTGTALTEQTVSFPLTFPTSVFSVVFTGASSAASSAAVWRTAVPTTSGFKYSAEVGGNTVLYMTIGI